MSDICLCGILRKKQVVATQEPKQKVNSVYCKEVCISKATVRLLPRKKIKYQEILTLTENSPTS